MSTPTGPNQQDQAGDKTSHVNKQQQQDPGKATGQHTGGLLNQQDEPQTAEEAKQRAAKDAQKSK